MAMDASGFAKWVTLFTWLKITLALHWTNDLFDNFPIVVIDFKPFRVWTFLHDKFSHSPPPLRGLIFGLSDVDNFTEMARFLSRTHSLKIMPRHSTRLGWWCCDVARSALRWLESMCVNFSSLSVCCCSFFFRGEVIGELCSNLTFTLRLTCS